jgi:hypothetical protein
MGEIIHLLGPFGMLTVILGFINMVISLRYAVELLILGRTDRIKGMDRGIDSILLVTFVMLFCTFIDPIFDTIRAYSSVAVASSGDPKVVLAGLIQFFLPMIFSLLLCSFFFIVWFILRARYRQLLERIGKV